MSARSWVVAVVALGLGGCTSVAVESGGSFPTVAGLVRDRIGRDISPSASNDVARTAVRELLADGLTGEDAVRAALLGNRELRALYLDLDVAQSDLVQASLLHNPVADLAVGFPLEGGIVDLSFGLAVDVIDLLYVPLRERVAAAALAETELRVAAEVLDLVGRVQTTFHRHQAAEQLLEMRRRVAEATALARDLAQRMRDAGNITELELATEQAMADETRLELRLAEIDVSESREELNRLLGLWGEDAAWTLASSRLPDPPDDAFETEDVERLAVERSLDLGMAEYRIVAAGEQLGLNEASALFPEVLTGAEASREGDWDVGPTLSIPLPFFDRGQARTARARAELERARELYVATAVHVRSVARAARDRVAGHRDRARFYRHSHLPLTERIVRETELQMNAMQVGPFEVLRAKERQIEAGARYVESLRDYWLARAELGLILAGRIPPTDGAPTGPAIESPRRSSIPTLN